MPGPVLARPYRERSDMLRHTLAGSWVDDGSGVMLQPQPDGDLSARYRRLAADVFMVALRDAHREGRTPGPAQAWLTGTDPTRTGQYGFALWAAAVGIDPEVLKQRIPAVIKRAGQLYTYSSRRKARIGKGAGRPRRRISDENISDLQHLPRWVPQERCCAVLCVSMAFWYHLISKAHIPYRTEHTGRKGPPCRLIDRDALVSFLKRREEECQ